MRHTGLIQTLLGQAIYTADLNPHRVNTDLFEYRVEKDEEIQRKRFTTNQIISLQLNLKLIPMVLLIMLKHGMLRNHLLIAS